MPELFDPLRWTQKIQAFSHREFVRKNDNHVFSETSYELNLHGDQVTKKIDQVNFFLKYGTVRRLAGTWAGSVEKKVPGMEKVRS